MKAALNVRQHRFCELIVGGSSATHAYINAGYKVSLKVAGTNGPRMLHNAGISARIRDLRRPQTHRILMSRDEKRAWLRETAENRTIGAMVRIKAMELDSKLAGHFEPDRPEIELGPKTLLSIKERAEQICEDMRRRYGNI